MLRVLIIMTSLLTLTAANRSSLTTLAIITATNSKAQCQSVADEIGTYFTGIIDGAKVVTGCVQGQDTESEKKRWIAQVTLSNAEAYAIHVSNEVTDAAKITEEVEYRTAAVEAFDYENKTVYFREYEYAVNIPTYQAIEFENEEQCNEWDQANPLSKFRPQTRLDLFIGDYHDINIGRYCTTNSDTGKVEIWLMDGSIYVRQQEPEKSVESLTLNRNLQESKELGKDSNKGVTRFSVTLDTLAECLENKDQLRSFYAQQILSNDIIAECKEFTQRDNNKPVGVLTIWNTVGLDDENRLTNWPTETNEKLLDGPTCREQTTMGSWRPEVENGFIVMKPVDWKVYRVGSGEFLSPDDCKDPGILSAEQVLADWAQDGVKLYSKSEPESDLCRLQVVTAKGAQTKPLVSAGEIHEYISMLPDCNQD